MRLFTEIKIDIDLEFHNPCLLAIRILRILSFCKLLNYYVEFCSSPTKGIHIRIYVPEKIPLHKLFIARALLGDDWMRLQYDYARFSKGLVHTMLFNLKIRRENGKVLTKGSEKRLDIEKFLDDLIKICEYKVRRKKLNKKLRK